MKQTSSGSTTPSNERRESGWPFEMVVSRGVTTTESLLWVLVIASFAGDLLLTYYGLQHGFQEGNPLVRFAIDHGGFALFGLAKALVLGLGGLFRACVPKYGTVTALGLALPWFMAVLVNFSHLTVF